MCGITGIYNFKHDKPVAPDQIKQMTDAIAHRGPDGEGQFITPSQKVGLGHRRLSIIDLSEAGAQPMHNHSRSISIVFNGEIYNHSTLRENLEKQGYTYNSDTDTESIIYQYQEKGIDCLQDLEGMFAFAIWDEQKKRLVLARDRIGVKPLYYTIHNGQFFFASEIKAILANREIPRDVNEEALYHYLTFVNTPAPHTLFKDIYKLPAGHYLTIDQHGRVETKQWWDAVVPQNPDQEKMSEEELTQEILRLLKQSIKDRMMSDVPFGVFLSGGVDSSTNVALMSEMHNQPIKTFSIGFKNSPQYNELEYAQQIADHFKTDHHEILIDHTNLLEFLPKLIHHQDEPIADPVCVPLYYVSKLAKDSGVTVVQVGEGSDEQFSGYHHYLNTLHNHHKYFKPISALPSPLKKLLWLSAAPYLKLTHQTHRIENLKRALNMEEAFVGGAIAFGETEKSQLLSNDFAKRTLRFNSNKLAQEIMNNIDAAYTASPPDPAMKSGSPDYVERMIYLELKNRLSELLLMRVDKITMATSIESRVPFLDHRLIEFTMNIPESLKIKGQEPKYILKKAVEGILPDNIIYRKKMGFGAPIHEWFMDEIGEYFERTLLTSSIVKRNYLNYNYVKQILELQKKGINYSFQLWNLFNLSLWYDYWIEGKEIVYPNS